MPKGTVMVRWVQHSFYFVSGMAYRRVPGDEDVLDEASARKYIRSGAVVLSDKEPPVITFESVKKGSV